jgi:tRNA C32,U32 (ribose-2'-O)-methylase TrmJ
LRDALGACDFDALLAAERPEPERMFALTTRGSRLYTDVRYAPGDWLVFGAETRGLSAAMRERIAAERRLRLPMRPGSRSMNLSNAVAVVVFEAWRQQDFAGGVREAARPAALVSFAPDRRWTAGRAAPFGRAAARAAPPRSGRRSAGGGAAAG